MRVRVGRLGRLPISVCQFQLTAALPAPLANMSELAVAEKSKVPASPPNLYSTHPFAHT